MAARLGLDNKVKELRLGDTFTKNYKEGAYHTIRYDFKPASMDKQKMGTVEVEGNHQVTVTVPHVEGSGTSQTVFKGNHKPVARECILIIDHNTGEIVLERISQTINLKTTRPEVNRGMMTTQRPTTPLDPISRKNSPPQQKCSPGHIPSRGMTHTRPSPTHIKNSPSSKSSPISSKSPNPSMNVSGSMPLLGFDDNTPNSKDVGVMSESSSDSESNSSSSSSSDSDSDSEGDQERAPKKANGHGNSGGGGGGGGGGNINNGPNCLMEDLDLSSVSEDSD